MGLTATGDSGMTLAGSMALGLGLLPPEASPGQSLHFLPPSL